MYEYSEALISHEAICQWIYKEKLEGGNLHGLSLRAKERYRKSRKVTDDSRGGYS